jgi:hypothetical protein
MMLLPLYNGPETFMLEQGYNLETHVKEDNKSTLLLMKNGKLSSGKRTMHFDIRYYYAKDLIDRGVIKVSHCVSEDTVADFFTKPLQGKHFMRVRNIMLNDTKLEDSVDPVTIDEHRSMLDNIES